MKRRFSDISIILLMFCVFGFIAGCNEQGNQPESTWGTMVWDESEWQ